MSKTKSQLHAHHHVGLTVAEAGQAAARVALEAERPPDWWPRRWDETLRGLRAFLEGGWGDRALALRWRPEELYRPPRSLRGVNRFGLAFLIGDGRVMAVTKESITVEQPELQLKGQQYGRKRDLTAACRPASGLD